MAKDEVIGAALGRAAREMVDALAGDEKSDSNGHLSGVRGIAAGAGLVALAPLVRKLAGGNGLKGAGPMKMIGKGLGAGVKSAVGGKLEGSNGPAKIAKEVGKRVLSDAGEDDSGADASEDDSGADASDDDTAAAAADASENDSGADPGVGSGRRMPVQQAVDVGVPLRTAYNEWTQFEEWPKFMHRVARVTQDDNTHVTVETKIWGISKTFQAEIVDQRPDERIKWHVSEGPIHAGVVTFHSLSDRLTRIEVSLDLEPGSLLEKAGRGMRYLKRAVRADLARFKAHLEMEGKEGGAWRGTIEDGKVKPRRRGSSSGRRQGGSSSGRRRGSSGNRRKSSSTSGRSRSRS
jgi:uncharacterized membrane protein